MFLDGFELQPSEQYLIDAGAADQVIAKRSRSQSRPTNATSSTKPEMPLRLILLVLDGFSLRHCTREIAPNLVALRDSGVHAPPLSGRATRPGARRAR